MFSYSLFKQYISILIKQANHEIVYYQPNKRSKQNLSWMCLIDIYNKYRDKNINEEELKQMYEEFKELYIKRDVLGGLEYE